MFPIAMSIDRVMFEVAFHEFERCNWEVSIGSPAAGVLFIHDPAVTLNHLWLHLFGANLAFGILGALLIALVRCRP